ncbi:hypothetical protein HY357_04470 [Candidatus Roizmanbacteria bacterium]|nr:hypothetical protein [Candidatus Roizmanbacteria bacterium]
MHELRLFELPEEFIWQECRTIQALVPKPKLWPFIAEYKGKTRTYTFVKNQAPKGELATGLTLTALKEMATSISSRVPFDTVPIITLESLPNLTAEGNMIIESNGPFLIARRLFNNKNNEAQTKIYTEVTSNLETGTGYILTFVAPEKDWGIDGPIGEFMIDNRFLSPNY